MIQTEVDKRCGTETGDIDFDCACAVFRTRQDTPKSYNNKRTHIGPSWFHGMKVTFFMKNSTTLQPNGRVDGEGAWSNEYNNNITAARGGSSDPPVPHAPGARMT